MVGFCGIFNMGNGRVSFDALRRMNLTRGFGCAFLTRELGLLCSGMDSAAHSMQPVSLRYNNAPYTAAAVCSDSPLGENGGKLARSVIEAYIEEGDSFLRRSADGFSFCLYDGRCGELMLLRGNSPLFYSIRDDLLYFSTSLPSLLRIFGGCVRVDKKALSSFVCSDYSPLPSGLFRDVTSLERGQCLICTRLGAQTVSLPQGLCLPRSSAMPPEAPPFPSELSMDTVLDRALMTFGYPQFDVLMPSIESRIASAYDLGETLLCINDPIFCASPLYCAERMQRMGAPYGIRLKSSPLGSMPSRKQLKAMEKQLDCLLDASMEEQSSIPWELEKQFGTVSLAGAEKDTPLRIRKKALLRQIELWQERYNAVFV